MMSCAKGKLELTVDLDELLLTAKLCLAFGRYGCGICGVCCNSWAGLAAQAAAAWARRQKGMLSCMKQFYLLVMKNVWPSTHCTDKHQLSILTQ